ncbi:MAG: GNAT family N-acetyltransferase [Ruminococcus sp.]|nr:GNAT family N-acetyltransferase [Ruminococcus sp.]
MGVVMEKDGEIVSGASSYSSYVRGIEIEIDTREDYRRRGLAYIWGRACIWSRFSGKRQMKRHSVSVCSTERRFITCLAKRRSSTGIMILSLIGRGLSALSSPRTRTRIS